MILLNDFKRQWEDTRAEVASAIEAVGESGWYILGNEVRAFESALAQQWRLKYAVGVASGMDAIEISLKVLGCEPGDYVLTTPLSAFATTLAIMRLGAVPVFVDTDRFGLIDLEQCRQALHKRPEIRYMVPVHLYGHAIDQQALAEIRDKFECRIVEDCAQSIGACFQGVQAGTSGHLAATSFYPTKNLGALGDGGALLTGSDVYRDAARTLRDYGQSRKYQHDCIGYNSRLDELQAAVMRRVCLPRLERWTTRRREIARRYLDGIQNVRISVPGAPCGSESVWHLFPVLLEASGKADFMSHMADNGINCGEHYPIPIPEQRALAGVRYEVFRDCQTATAIARSEVSLPIHPYLHDDEVAQVIDACNRWSK